jgi:hypothetical protein
MAAIALGCSRYIAQEEYSLTEYPCSTIYIKPPKQASRAKILFR